MAGKQSAEARPARGKAPAKRIRVEEAVPRPRRSYSWMAIVAICALVLAAPAISSSASRQQSGYVSLVNAIFGPMNWLRVAGQADSAGTDRIVDLTPQARSLRAVREFELRSPLYADLRANNLGLWNFSGRHVEGMQAGAHRAAGPFGADVWRGDILYGYAGGFAQLVDDQGHAIQLQSSAVRNEARVSIEGAAALQEPLSKFTFYDSNRPVADVMLAGRNVLVTPHPDSGTRVLVDERLDARTSKNADTGDRPLVLADAGTIRFTHNGVPTGGIFRLNWSRPALSSYREFGAPLLDPGLSPFWRNVASAIASSMPANGETVRLTLDRDLDRLAEAELQTAITSLPPQPVPHFRGAVTVLDSQTGEILAMASALGPGNAVEPGEAASTRQEINNNLVTLPVGSAAKVPMSAALVSQWPDLRKLNIHSTSKSFDTVLGVHLGNRNEEHTVPGWLDFPTFLQISSNKYASALMLMGVAADPGVANGCASEPYQFEGDSQARNLAPTFSWPTVSCAQMPFVGRMSSLQQSGGRASNWLLVFKMLFDADYLEQPPEVSQRWTSVWSGLPLDPEQRGRAMGFASPEFESFRLNYPRNIVGDYIELILGGGAGRWSTVSLAQAYSRVVTGRRVAATLIRYDRAPAPILLEAPNDQGQIKPGNILSRVGRAKILEGMGRVPRTGAANPNGLNGTAASLYPALTQLARYVGNGQELRVFAKTGTPLLGYSVEIPARVVLSELAAMGKMTLDGQGLPRMRTRPGESDLTALERQAAVDRGHFSAAALARSLGEIREELRVSGANIGTREHLTLPTTRTVLKKDSANIRGGTLVIVIGRYCREDTESLKPVRALTLAINIEARNGSANPAIPLARALLSPESRFARLLMNDPATGAAQCQAR